MAVAQYLEYLLYVLFSASLLTFLYALRLSKQVEKLRSLRKWVLYDRQIEPMLGDKFGGDMSDEDMAYKCNILQFVISFYLRGGLDLWVSSGSASSRSVIGFSDSFYGVKKVGQFATKYPSLAVVARRPN